ncbi:MAG: ATP-binding protein [Alphaproteobacteria bacterium]
MTRRTRPRERRSLRRFLLTRMLGISVLSFSLLGIATYLLIVRPTQDELARVAMELSADRLRGEFRSAAAGASQFLAVLRDWVPMGDADLRQPQDLVRLTIPQLRNRPFLLNVLFAQPDGVGLIVGKNGDGFLARMIDEATGPGRQRWLHYDASGKPLREETVERQYDPRERPWFVGAMRDPPAQSYWTDPYIFFETRDVGLTLSTALPPVRGRQALVIGLDFTLREISALTRQYRLGRSGGMTLMTEDGKVLGLPFGAAPDGEQGTGAGLLRLPRELGLDVVAAGWDLWEAHGRPGHAEVLDFAGEPWIVHFRPLRIDNLSLIIAAAAPRSDFGVGGIRDAAMMAALVLGVLVVAYLISRQISGRLQRVVSALAAESQRIGAMELDRPVRVPSRLREIATLVDAQERMRLMLRAATGELEQTVALRTRELGEREALLRTILDTLPIGLGMVRRDGGTAVMVMTNPAGAAMFGFALDELVGRPMPPVWADEADRERYLSLLGEHGAVSGFEARMRRRDGAEIWVSLTAVAMRHEGHTVDLAVYQDVTARREVEQTLRAEKQKTLDALIQLHEAQDQLVQAEKMSALAGLVAGVAHEINTPVGIAYTAASTLSDEAARLAGQAEAGTARRSDVMRFLALARETTALMETHCRNAADLIQSFKKVAVDQSSDDRRRFRLADCLEDVVLSLRPQYRKAGHHVTIDCPPEIEIDGYPGAITQIVTNLVVNSTVHAYPEGVAGNLRLSARVVGADRIELRYQDDGAGIPPEHRGRIFEPFFTTRRGRGGSGLGLHILHNIVVVKLGGQVRYEDTPGGGATFVMEFPAKAKAEPGSEIAGGASNG